MSKLNTSSGSSSGIAALALSVPLQVSSRTFGAAKGGMSKVITMVLCQDELYKSDGTATWVVDIFDLAQIRELGPMISQIRVKTNSGAVVESGRLTVVLEIELKS